MTKINIFTDFEKCKQFLAINDETRVFIIISGVLGMHVVPLIHDMHKIQVIFIFCGNKTRYEQWAKDWRKINGVFTEMKSLCQALKQAARYSEQNVMPMSFVQSGKRLDQLDPSFMYTQIIKEILLNIKFTDEHVDDYANYCRGLFADNKVELSNINKFQREYRENSPIWWYTSGLFLRSMLNRALQAMDGDIMTRMGFFISDLHRNIEKVQQDHPIHNVFTVYRGQGLSQADFDQLRTTKGGLISFNNFMTTDRSHQNSISFAESAASNPDLVGVVFVMEIDPTQSTTPFAPIYQISYFPEEDQVLFSMHTVFRIQNIKSISGNKHLYEVDLTLTSDNDEELSVLAQRIRQESYPEKEEWYRLGLVLAKMGQIDKAEEIYRVLLNKTMEDSEQSLIYNELGMIKYNQGQYKEAIKYYETSLAINDRDLSPNHPDLALSYNNIGMVYSSMGDYSKASEYYEKALDIREQSIPSNHPDVASTYNNIGAVYSSMGEYSKAAEYYEKALAIQQQSLPSNHPDLASSYNNIGMVYSSMGDYRKALEYYEKALTIRQQSLPANHPDLALSYNNIGAVYSDMGDYRKALEYYERASEIQEHSLPSNHPDLAPSYNNIGMWYSSMDDYPKALEYYEKALAIQQESLPENHPDLGSSYNNIGAVYSDMGDYRKALEYYEKALTIRQQSLPANHPDLASSYNNIGAVYSDMGDYRKALEYYERASEIQEHSLPSNHPDLALSYNNIGMAYYSMGDYLKALGCYERALKIRQQSLPPNHPDLGSSYSNIGMVYSSMGDYSKALEYYEKALSIRQHSLPSNHPDLASSYDNMGLLYEKMSDYSKSLSFLERALKIGEQSLPANHPHVKEWKESFERVKDKL
ncbi:unnamed protein product [Adineta ricciae]|uniref:Uncharacterized protein n=2 Tax=Adineta ricciae TaxID=249248 RepID=A0A815TDX9_ADIRI|nr:unnamed protein product [Adineta ricciae]